MSDFNLTKKKQMVFNLLKSKGVNKAPVMRVGGALDISGSMGSIIRGGKLQHTVDQLMGPALTFDDNGEIDMWKFDTVCEEVGTCSPGNYHNFVTANNIHARGATAFSPIVSTVQDFYFGSKPAEQPKKLFGFSFGKKAAPEPAVVDNTPVLMMIITDGEVDTREQQRTFQLLQQAVSTPIYYHFVAVGGGNTGRGGPDAFPTIHYLADALPNVGEVYLPEFGMTDEQVYEQLICDELIEFVNKFEGHLASA